METGTKLLVIEDHEDSADALRQLLEHFGYRVMTVGPDSAEAAFEQFEPSCVLLHLGHPNNPWLDLAHRFHLARPGVEVVGLTGWHPSAFDKQETESELMALLPKGAPIVELIKILPPA